MNYQYNYNTHKLNEDNKHEKSDFIVLIKYSSNADKLFVSILEGYKIPYSYDDIEGDYNEKTSEYTFNIDFLDVIKVIIDMRDIQIIKII